MNKVLEQFNEIGIIPVVVLDHKEDAAPLAHALCQGGLPAAEVTFRTREAAACIEAMRAARPDMLVGAGTVLTTKQVDEAIKAGAQFIVSPGFDEDVVKYCIKKDIPVTPGTCTPSDVQKAYRLGLPGRTGWRNRDDQSDRCPLYDDEVHAYWRHFGKEYGFILERGCDPLHRRKLDGQERSDRQQRIR